jgi:hypothetical protein
MFKQFFDGNEITAFIPEQWAMEGVALLYENMIASRAVNRDFEDEFQDHGDVVNTRQPIDLRGKRKGVNDDVTIQKVRARNIQIPLDQHCHVSFIIRDGEQTKAFQELKKIYLQPQMIALARVVDKFTLCQYVHFLQNQAGALGGLTDANGVNYIAKTRGVLNRNKCPEDGRFAIWGTDADTLLTQNTTFVQAQRAGDGGELQTTGSLGRKFGFDNHHCQNMAQVDTDTTLGTGTINNGVGYGKGTKTLTVTGFAADEVLPGSWIAIGGNVYHVVSTNASTATSITLEWGLVNLVADAAPITVFDSATVVNSYEAGDENCVIEIDNGAGGLPTTNFQVGQAFSFGTSTVKYAALEVDVGATSVKIELDRPLAEAVTAGSKIFYGPAGGGFNLAFHPNCMTLAIRPLNLPGAGLAQAAYASWGGVTVRIVFTYLGVGQGTLVTADFLAGIKVLDTNLGAVCLT